MQKEKNLHTFRIHKYHQRIAEKYKQHLLHRSHAIPTHRTSKLGKEKGMIGRRGNKKQKHSSIEGGYIGEGGGEGRCMGEYIRGE